MVPTFPGRLQTRLFALVVIALPWTLLSVPPWPLTGGLARCWGGMFVYHPVVSRPSGNPFTS
jgi:hypothetical protein